jgi:RNA exonuclease 1
VLKGLEVEPNRQQGVQKKGKSNQWKPLPQSVPQPAKAIALDCEMGPSRTGETELIRVTAVDFFTQEVLLDRLVCPQAPMLHYNTRYSGVSRQDMDAAVKSGSCIFGKDAAREELWKFVGPETIIIAHGGQNDLSALRWIHPYIIDTCILESYTGTKLEGGHSLKNLCARKLGLVIQKGFGHDSIEDSLACRELCHFWAQQIPEIPYVEHIGSKDARITD